MKALNTTVQKASIQQTKPSAPVTTKTLTIPIFPKNIFAPQTKALTDTFTRSTTAVIDTVAPITPFLRGIDKAKTDQEKLGTLEFIKQTGLSAGRTIKNNPKRVATNVALGTAFALSSRFVPPAVTKNILSPVGKTVGTLFAVKTAGQFVSADPVDRPNILGPAIVDVGSFVGGAKIGSSGANLFTTSSKNLVAVPKNSVFEEIKTTKPQPASKTLLKGGSGFQKEKFTDVIVGRSELLTTQKFSTNADLLTRKELSRAGAVAVGESVTGNRVIVGLKPIKTKSVGLGESDLAQDVLRTQKFRPFVRIEEAPTGIKSSLPSSLSGPETPNVQVLKIPRANAPTITTRGFIETQKIDDLTVGLGKVQTFVQNRPRSKSLTVLEDITVGRSKQAGDQLLVETFSRQAPSSFARSKDALQLPFQTLERTGRVTQVDLLRTEGPKTFGRFISNQQAEATIPTVENVILKGQTPRNILFTSETGGITTRQPSFLVASENKKTFGSVVGKFVDTPKGSLKIKDPAKLKLDKTGLTLQKNIQQTGLPRAVSKLDIIPKSADIGKPTVKTFASNNLLSDINVVKSESFISPKTISAPIKTTSTFGITVPFAFTSVRATPSKESQLFGVTSITPLTTSSSDLDSSQQTILKTGSEEIFKPISGGSIINTISAPKLRSSTSTSSNLLLGSLTGQTQGIISLTGQTQKPKQKSSQIQRQNLLQQQFQSRLQGQTTRQATRQQAVPKPFIGGSFFGTPRVPKTPIIPFGFGFPLGSKKKSGKKKKKKKLLFENVEFFPTVISDPLSVQSTQFAKKGPATFPKITVKSGRKFLKDFQAGKSRFPTFEQMKGGL